MAAFADLLLVIATEEPTSLTDAYAVLKLHAADGAGAMRGWSSTRRRAAPRASAPMPRCARACTTFLGRDAALAGIIRRDERVRDAIRRQSLLLTRHPGCPAAQDVEALAHVL